MTKLVDYYADWCGPCKIMAPIIKELETEYPSVAFEKINVDEARDKTQEAGVMGVPTFIVLRDGKEVGRKVGQTSKQELASLIAE